MAARRSRAESPGRLIGVESLLLVLSPRLCFRPADSGTKLAAGASMPTVEAIFDQIVQMTGLRRLRLEGHPLLDHGDRPNDRDLLRLHGITGLKRLELSACPAVGEAAIEELRRARPLLTICRK
jgi:hypothetical protein